MKTQTLGLGLIASLALTSLALMGCAASSDESAPVDPGDEQDLTARQLPGVVAVEVAEVRNQNNVLSAKTLGAPKKVKSILGAVRKLRGNEAVPRCLMQDTTRLTFLNAAGEKVATVGSYCGGYGSIAFESGKPGYGVKFEGGAIETAKDAPFAVGDALYGIQKIEVSKPGRPDKKTLTGAAMQPILDGFDLDAIPDPQAALPRCLPSHAVTFSRADKDVAYTSFLCSVTSPPPAKLTASFSAPDPSGKTDAAPLARGAIQIDPRPIVQALESAQ